MTIVSIIILYMPSGLLTPNTNGGKMAFATAGADAEADAETVSFPLLEIEEKFPLVISIKQTTSSVVVQYITSAGGGAVCEQCQFIVYKPIIKKERPVIAYASETPLDLSDAKRIVFFAKGELGGETIKALAIGKSPDLVSTPPLNTLQFEVVSPNIVLTKDWKRYELHLGGLDLQDVSSPFGLVISNQREGGLIFPWPGFDKPPFGLGSLLFDEFPEILKQRGISPIFPGDDDSDTPPPNNDNVKEVSFYLKGVAIDNMPATNPINIIGSESTSSDMYAFTPMNMETSVIPMQPYPGLE
ncbi:MAG TPA: hypothetical protein VJR94_00560 [Candidatus Nitrosocosmicus sp.]|nr:hypothetical protein [Candidatus Nitrosocosmicus sp.]